VKRRLMNRASVLTAEEFTTRVIRYFVDHRRRGATRAAIVRHQLRWSYAVVRDSRWKSRGSKTLLVSSILCPMDCFCLSIRFVGAGLVERSA
jgi:hypothetical protein